MFTLRARYIKIDFVLILSGKGGQKSKLPYIRWGIKNDRYFCICGKLRLIWFWRMLKSRYSTKYFILIHSIINF